MRATLSQWSIPMLAGLLLVTMPGCSKKSVQSGGDTQSSQSGMAKGAPGAGGIGGPTGSAGSTGGGVSSNFPDTSLAGRDGSGGLRGLDKNPGEERVNGGTMMAKLDPSQSGRQMDEIRSEQAAADAAGLRDVFFAFDSFAISEEGRQSLSRDAEWIKSNPGSQLKIEGH
jgi:peptidoglycan-associated lipoprotein